MYVYTDPESGHPQDHLSPTWSAAVRPDGSTSSSSSSRSDCAEQVRISLIGDDDETACRPRSNSPHWSGTTPQIAGKKRGLATMARENQLTMTQSTAATLGDNDQGQYLTPIAKKMRPFSQSPNFQSVDFQACLRQIKQLKEVLMTMGDDVNVSRLMCGVCDVALVKMYSKRTEEERLLCWEVERFLEEEISKTNEKFSRARQKLSAACSDASLMRRRPGLRPLIKKLTDKKRSLEKSIRISNDGLFFQRNIVMKKLSDDVKAKAEKKWWVGDLLADICHGRRPSKKNLDKLPSVLENKTLAAIAPVVIAMHHSERGVFDQFSCKVIAHELEQVFQKLSREFTESEGTLLSVGEGLRRSSEKHYRKLEALRRTEEQLQDAIQERDRVQREEDERKKETRSTINEISSSRKRHDQLRAALVTFRTLQVGPVHPASPLRSTPTTRWSPGSSSISME